MSVAGGLDMPDASTTGKGTPLSDPAERFDVVVVGAGQAGLAIGHFLARQGLQFVILEAADRVGAAWRDRWHSLMLFTPRRYDSLPGLTFPGDPDGYPGRDEVAAYLDRYVAARELPVELNSQVRRLVATDGKFVLTLDNRQIQSDQVVVATGPFHTPILPALADQLASDVVQMHSAGSRRAGDIPEGRVLVVGGGNTGFQIAKELSATHSVYLAIGSRQTPLPQKVLGRDLFWWLTKTGLIHKTVDSRLGRRARQRDTLIGSSVRRLRHYGVEAKARVVGASGRTVSFADGSRLAVDAVIWATGYRADHSWINVPVLDSRGEILHGRGVTDVPGLFFLGLSWQHTRGSALLGWVKEDAEFIASQIAGVRDARDSPAAQGSVDRTSAPRQTQVEQESER
jgi:putative flavoprotein involved in K+ transport